MLLVDHCSNAKSWFREQEGISTQVNTVLLVVFKPPIEQKINPRANHLKAVSLV